MATEFEDITKTFSEEDFNINEMFTLNGRYDFVATSKEEIAKGLPAISCSCFYSWHYTRRIKVSEDFNLDSIRKEFESKGYEVLNDLPTSAGYKPVKVYEPRRSVSLDCTTGPNKTYYLAVQGVEKSIKPVTMKKEVDLAASDLIQILNEQ